MGEGEIQKEQFTAGQKFKFIFPSILGVLLLTIPFKHDGHSTVMVSVLSRKLQKFLSSFVDIHILVLIAIFTSFVLTLIYRLHRPRWMEENTIMLEVVDVSIYWLITRMLGFLIGLAVALGPRLDFIPETLYGDRTGGLILYELIVGLFTIFMVAGFILPFLMSFGLLEFMGVLLTKVMRPVFKLPGCAAVDCVVSWIGDSTIGVALTGRQYAEGHYSEREAAVVATSFSLVSITYCIIVLSNVDMMDLFGFFYLTVLLAGLACALVVPRIPPLSLKKEDYCTEEKMAVDEDVPEGFTRLEWAWHVAVKKAESDGGIIEYFKKAIMTVLELWFTVLPTAMSIATIVLVVDATTPLFQWLAMPFEPFLNLLRVPLAEEAAHSIVIGFADIIVPSIRAADLSNPMTKFIVAAVSVVQLIYMSETGADLLGSNIPVNFLDLVVIFIERTIVALPVVVLMAHILF